MKIFSVSGAIVASFDLDYDETPIATAIKNWKRVPQGQDVIDAEYVKRGVVSYERNVDFLEEAKLTKLRQNFQKCCDLYTEKFNLDKVVITKSWFNILYLGSEFQLHNHTLDSTVLVGIYYFKIGKGSCPLIIEQSDKPFFKLRPYNGRLIILPGWIKHGVEINKSLERGSISFNTNYRKENNDRRI